MSWTKSVTLLIVLGVLSGCSSSETEQKLKMQEAKIRSLSNDNNMLVDQNQQLNAERNVFKAKWEASQSEVNGYQRSEAAYVKVIAAKDAQIARERSIASAAEARAVQAKKDASRTVINMSGYPGGAGATRPASGPGVGPTKSSARGKYHLRIISLPGNSRGQKTAQEMASYLKSQGISDVVPRKSGRFWVIDIGHFNSIRSSEATALKNKVRGLRYKGIKQFRSAYFAQY